SVAGELYPAIATGSHCSRREIHSVRRSWHPSERAVPGSLTWYWKDGHMTRTLPGEDTQSLPVHPSSTSVRITASLQEQLYQNIMPKIRITLPTFCVTFTPFSRH